VKFETLSSGANENESHVFVVKKKKEEGWR
jgi:hypothetical protein